MKYNSTMYMKQSVWFIPMFIICSITINAEIKISCINLDMFQGVKHIKTNILNRAWEKTLLLETMALSTSSVRKSYELGW